MKTRVEKLKKQIDVASRMLEAEYKKGRVLPGKVWSEAKKRLRSILRRSIKKLS